MPLNDQPELSIGENPVQVLAFDQILDKLAALNPMLVRVVECRDYRGMTINETAEALEISQRGVTR